MVVGKGGLIRRSVRGAVLAVLTLVVGTCSAQVAASAPRPDDGWTSMANTVFEHSTTHDGLPHAIATSITEGRDGALWIGTQDGVTRWDGSQFRTYNDATGLRGLPSTYVRAVSRDARGRVWVGTDGGGLARYDDASDRFIRYSDRTIVGIAPDATGGVWAASTKGLIHVHANDVVEMAWPHGGMGADALLDANISSVLQDRHGTVWVGSSSGLVARYMDGGAGVHVDLPGLAKVAAGVDALFEDERGALWIGTRLHGVFVRDPRDGSIRQVHAESPDDHSVGKAAVTSFADDGHGHVWIGTQTSGLLVADARTLQAHPIAHGKALRSDLPTKWIWGLFRDHSGQMWVASTSGVSRSAPQQDAIVTLLASDDSGWVDPYVFAIDVLPGGDVLLGQKVGMEVINPATRRMAALHVRGAGVNLVAIAHASATRSYVGASDGLFEMDTASKRLRRVPLPQLGAEQRVTALLLQGDGLWIGSAHSGLWRTASARPGAAVQQVVSANQLRDPSINVIIDDRYGGIWIGTSDGVDHYVPGRPVEHVALWTGTTATPANSTVNTLLLDRRNRLWIGTSDGLAVVVGSGTTGAPLFKRMDRSSGLASTNIDALLQDDRGRIWASTDEGIAVIDENDFSLRVLHEKDGLAIATYWVNSAAMGTHGELLFGGLGGLTIVRPDRLEKAANSVAVVVSGVRIDSTTLAPGQIGDPAHVVVPPAARSFAVDFSAVDFSGMQQTRYAYHLDGFDSGWQDTDMAHRTATYTNLPPDHYTLRIKAVDRRGLWTDPLTIAIDVKPAWYQTWWFQAIKALLALLAVAAIVALRGPYQRRRARELQRLVDQRTAELANAQVRLEELAYSDALTALPNRRMFGDQLQRLIASCGRQGTSFALLLIDLDHFKQINDTKGHDAGDALLVEVARRLREMLRQSEFVARLGGDEFAILLSDESDRTGIDVFCQRMLDCFRASVMFKDIALQASPSVGVALFPADGTTQDELYKSADLALYEAKRAGRRTWRFAASQGASAFGATAPEAARQP